MFSRARSSFLPRCGAALAISWLLLSSSGIGAPPEGEKACPVGPLLQTLDQVEPEEFSWGWIRWMMNANRDPEAKLTLGVVYIKPHQTNPLHQHPTTEEVLYVISGSCEHRVGDKTVTLTAGDVLRVPAGVVHTARTRDEACKVVVVYNKGERDFVVVEE